MSLAAIDRDALPVEYVAEGDRSPCVTIMTGHGRNRNQPLFVFDGPEGGELVVPFDRVRIDADRHRLVLTRQTPAGHRSREVKVFGAEYWSQWGEVSDWLEANAIDEVPRRFT